MTIQIRLLVICVFWLGLSLFLTAYSSRNPQVAGAGAALVAEIVKPVQVVSYSLRSFTVNTWRNYIFLIGLRQDLLDLQERIEMLESQNSRLLEFKFENERLRGLLKIAEQHQLKGVVSRVIGHDPSNWTQAAFIDKGRADGLDVGMIALVGDGVVGQLVAVGLNSAKVLLLTDHLSSIDVLVQSSRVKGVAEGLGGKELKVSYIEKGKDVRVGDRLITSGLGGIYPKGLLVGSVVQVKSDNSGLFQNVLLKPAVDLNALENILIVDGRVELVN